MDDENNEEVSEDVGTEGEVSEDSTTEIDALAAAASALDVAQTRIQVLTDENAGLVSMIVALKARNLELLNAAPAISEPSDEDEDEDEDTESRDPIDDLFESKDEG